MQSFLKECREAGLPAARLKSLQAMVIEDQAWVHRYRDGDIRATVHDYVRPCTGDQPPDS
jgi:hypothetical protein